MRFEYDRLTAHQLEMGLESCGLSPKSFARIFGINYQNMNRWLQGRLDVPPWVAPTLAMMASGKPGQNRSVAKKTAAWMIEGDKLNPKREYPFREAQGLADPTWEDGED